MKNLIKYIYEELNNLSLLPNLLYATGEDYRDIEETFGQRTIYENINFTSNVKSLATAQTVYIATEDGSVGTKGFVTDVLKNMDEYTCIYSCGPAPMFRALHRSITKSIPAEFSLEERMGCGFGACMGCSIETANGAKRVCKDGPVFEMEGLRWED